VINLNSLTGVSFFLKQLLSFSKLKLKIMITTELVNGTMAFVQKFVTRRVIDGKVQVVAVKRLLDRITLQPVAILEEIVIQR
jgi:hypothetical protein